MDDPASSRLAKETAALTPAERMVRFCRLQRECWTMMSEKGRQYFHRRNRRKRRVEVDENLR